MIYNLFQTDYAAQDLNKKAFLWDSEPFAGISLSPAHANLVNPNSTFRNQQSN